MNGPCPRPGCGGEVHTDPWGVSIPCPRAEPVVQADTGWRCPRCDCPDGHEQCQHCKVCPHADGRRRSKAHSVSTELTEAKEAIARVRAVLAERRTEVAEREADGMLPFGTPGASWCDAVTVTCARVEDALRVFPPSVAVPEPNAQEAP